MNLINLDPTEKLNECFNYKVHGCELEFSLECQIIPGCDGTMNVSVCLHHNLVAFTRAHTYITVHLTFHNKSTYYAE